MTLPDVPVTVRADAALLERAVANIVDNAVRYNRPNGSVAVALTRDGDRAFRLLVTDTGGGIGAEDFKTLTAIRRFRGDEHRNRRPGAPGLGLAVAREVADRFGLQLDLRRPAAGGFEAEISGRGVASLLRRQDRIRHAIHDRLDALQIREDRLQVFVRILRHPHPRHRRQDGPPAPMCFPSRMALMNMSSVQRPMPVFRSGVRLAVNETPHGPAHAVNVGVALTGQSGESFGIETFRFSGCPERARVMSGSGPFGPIFAGVWQSWQKPAVTMYSPRWA